MKIDYYTCESGDWEVLKVDGIIYTDTHSLSSYHFLKLLEENSCEVTRHELTDEEMEDGIYK